MVEPITTAGMLIAGISALSSVVQAYKAARDIGRDIEKEEIEKLVSLRKVSDKASKQLAKVISSDLLDDLLGNVEREQKRLSDILTDPNSARPKKDRVADEADMEICDNLRRIKRYNGGVLPDIHGEDLYKVWQSHSCG
jgi:hypothetical protein